MTDPNDETVGERLVERIALTQTLLDDNEQLRADIARLRLTDDEREAIRVAALELHSLHCGEFEKAATLRKLLERLA